MSSKKNKKTEKNFFGKIKKRSSKRTELTEGEKYIRSAEIRRKRGKKGKASFGFDERDGKAPKPRRVFGIGPGFIPYMIFLLFTVIFTQALLSSISTVLMFFAIIWFGFSLLYLLIMFLSVDSFVEHNGTEIYKNTETSFEIKIVNHSFLPAPFLEADLRIPGKRSLGCVLKRVKVALSPSGDYVLRKKVRFAYRGTYDVGVDTITVYDFFKIFRVNVRLYNYRSIYVMPRRYTLGKRFLNSVSDSQVDIRRNITGIERSDIAEIRDYVPGDPMKNIHWKLSSKSEELQVKNYNMNSGRTVYVFCDVAARFDTKEKPEYDDDINEYGIDGAVELAVAIASREMSEGNTCVLAWKDARDENGARVCSCHNNEEFLNVLRLFSTAPVSHENSGFTELTSLITETQNVMLIFVTSFMNGQFVTDVTRAASIAGGTGNYGTEVYYFSPADRINDEKAKVDHIAYIGRCKKALTEHSITFTETSAELGGHAFEQ